MRSMSRIDGSSSTTRMRGFGRAPASARRLAARSVSRCDALASYGRLLRLGRRLAGAHRPRAALNRQAHAHRRARADRGRHLNGAVVVGDDAVHDGQAEPGALLERAAERLEDARRAPRPECRSPRPATVSTTSRRRRPRSVVDRQQQPAARAPSRAGRWSPGSRRSAGSGSRRPRTRPARRARRRRSSGRRARRRCCAAAARRPARPCAMSSRASGEPLRPRVGQERPDRVVQPLRLAQHDVHQLRLLVAERQLLRAAPGSSPTSTPAGCGSRGRCRPPSRRPRPAAAAAARRARAACTSVTSWNVKRYPVRPSGNVSVRRGQADVDRRGRRRCDTA